MTVPPPPTHTRASSKMSLKTQLQSPSEAERVEGGQGEGQGPNKQEGGGEDWDPLEARDVGWDPLAADDEDGVLEAGNEDRAGTHWRPVAKVRTLLRPDCWLGKPSTEVGRELVAWELMRGRWQQTTLAGTLTEGLGQDPAGPPTEEQAQDLAWDSAGPPTKEQRQVPSGPPTEDHWQVLIMELGLQSQDAVENVTFSAGAFCRPGGFHKKETF